MKPKRSAAAANQEFLEEVITDPNELVRPYLAGAGIEETEVRFYLYRKVDKGPDAFLFRCSPDAFELEELGQKYGTGTYRLRIYVKDPDHPGGALRGGGLLPVEMPAGYKPPSAQAPAVNGEPSSFERMMIEIMRRSDERTEKLLEAIAAQKAEPPHPMNTLEGLTKLAEIVRPPAAAPAAAPGIDFTTTLNAAKTLLDLSQGLGGGAGAEPESVLLSGGLRVMEKMIDKAIADRAGGAAPAPALAAPAPPAQPAPVAPAAAPAENEAIVMFKLQLRAACRAAVAGDDPVAYAEDAYSFIPVADLEKLATDPNWFSVLVAAEPGCAVHQAWFTAGRDRLVALAHEDGVLTGSTPAGKVADSDTATHGTSTRGSAEP